MIYTCCAPFEQFNLILESGYDGIVLQGSFLAKCDDATFLAVRKKFQEGNLITRSVNAFCPPEISLVGPEHNPKWIRAYTKCLAERAVQLGITHIAVGSPNSRKLPENFSGALAMEQWKATLLTISDVCAEYKLQVCVEPLCTLECNWMNSTLDVLSVVKRLNRDNIGMTYDIYHAFAMGENSEPLSQAMPYVKLLHISQYIDGEKHYLRRNLMMDYAEYFDVLKANRYDGEFVLEATYDPVSYAVPASLPIMKDYFR